MRRPRNLPVPPPVWGVLTPPNIKIHGKTSLMNKRWGIDQHSYAHFALYLFSWEGLTSLWYCDHVASP